MPESFKVESLTGREEWSGRYGPMITYRITVNGGQEVDLNQKPETAAPMQGDEIWGHLEDGKYRPKLKKDQKDGGGGKGGTDDLGPIIHRQVALKILAPRINEGGLTDEIKRTSREIEQFIGEASGSSEETSNGTPNADVGERLYTLLGEAGIDSAAAMIIRDYALQEMNPAEQDAAIERLQQEATRGVAADRLKQRTEEALGEPLPDGASEKEDIPF